MWHIHTHKYIIHNRTWHASAVRTTQNPQSSKTDFVLNILICISSSHTHTQQYSSCSILAALHRTYIYSIHAGCIHIQFVCTVCSGNDRSCHVKQMHVCFFFSPLLVSERHTMHAGACTICTCVIEVAALICSHCAHSDVCMRERDSNGIYHDHVRPMISTYIMYYR